MGPIELKGGRSDTRELATLTPNTALPLPLTLSPKKVLENKYICTGLNSEINLGSNNIRSQLLSLFSRNDRAQTRPRPEPKDSSPSISLLLLPYIVEVKTR